MTLIVIDWGIGGLDTFARLARNLPTHDLHYLSDSGFTPWGKVEASALAARIRHLIARTIQRVAVPPSDLAVVVACNAASTVVEQLDLPIPVFEVIRPGVALLLRELESPGPHRLAVLGGARTIASHAHLNGLPSVSTWDFAEGLAKPGCPRMQLLELVAQPLSAHVEAGRLEGPELAADLDPLIMTLEEHGCEAALLACTHYPALLPALTRRAPRMRWLDPVSDPELGLVAEVMRATAGGRGQGRHTYTTSGDPVAMQVAARAAFGLTLPLPEHLP